MSATASSSSSSNPSRNAAASSSAASGVNRNRGVAVPAPESYLRRRRLVESRLAASSARESQLRKKRKENRQLMFKRAESYVKEYRDRARGLIQQKRDAKNAGNFYVEPEAKVAFVIRIRGINAVSPKTKKILQLFRLRQINNGVFVKLNKATVTMLRMVEPYITYGPPTLRTISELIYKRGYGKLNKQRIALADNKIIEAALGKYNLICIEDLIHEIYTCGPHFSAVANFLWPFKLSNPTGGFVHKGIHFNEGGDCGNREEEINRLVKRMN